MEGDGAMTRAFRCKQCGAIVESDNFPPTMREIYLTLEDAKLCEVCGGHLKIGERGNETIHEY